jgi:AhpD family alkylhydroperoxidase
MTQRLNFHEAGPEAMRALSCLEQHVSRSSLEPALRELVRVRISQLNGCAYCIDLHTAAARNAGESERRLALLPAWREAPLYAPREVAALEWAEVTTLVAETHVPDEVWARVHPHFSAAELVDLTLLIGAMNMWNRFAIAFRKLPQ